MSLALEAERAWAAGFFDGEGSVSCLNEVGRTPRIFTSVSQCDPEVLDRFQVITDVGNVRGPYSPKTKNSRPYWVYSTHTYADSFQVYETIAPYLGTVKTNQFQSALLQYAEWTLDPKCAQGHDMLPRKLSSKKPGFYCPTCFSIAGKKRMEIRWGSV